MELSERPVRRVLVALDAGPDYYGPLQRGADLARALGAELSVLFIEDANLFRLCELETAQIAFGSRSWRRLETATLERELRARAADARASLARVAEVAELAWSFEVWRGRADEALREAARHADLISLSRALRPLALPRTQARRRPEPAPAPVLAFYERAAAPASTARVLEIAARLARRLSVPLLIVAPGRGASADRRVRTAVEARLAELGVRAEWRAVPSGERAILKAMAEARARLVVLGARGPVVSAGLLDRIVHAAGAEALLVGDAGAGHPRET